MERTARDKNLLNSRLILCSVLFIGLMSTAMGDETKWIAVGNLHTWFSSAGGEREVGRTGLTSDQQDGLRWPAQFRWQDTQAAKALWIGSTNYDDPLVNKTFDYKVVHVGPRVLDDISEMMPQEFKMIGRFDHPSVFVDGVPGSNLMVAMDEVDEIDPTLKADRMIYNVVHTAIGITLNRKIYAFTNQYHDNYFVYDYVFKNTGIVKSDSSITHSQTLTDVVFFFQYRYAPTREGSVYGGGWTPQSASWGHSTINDTRGENGNWGEFGADPFRAQFAWLGIHSFADFNIIGGPAATGDGHLASSQYVGVLTLHADKSATEKFDDPSQPFTTDYLQSDLGITSGNSQFNSEQMAKEYEAMTAGHPAKRHGEDVGCPTPIDCNGFANTYSKAGEGNPGGYTHGQGFGPYTLELGDSIHIVLAEGVAGLNREMQYIIGGQWLTGSGPFALPNKVGGGTTNDPDHFKNAWVYTGEDSLFQTFERAIANYNSGFDIPQPPPPPELFEVTSGGNRITLSWSDNAENNPVNPAVGYEIYRAIHIPDTTYELVFACGEGTGNPIVHEYDDKSAIRGFDYYYYIISLDNGTANNIEPGIPLVSSKFYTMTTEPAFLRRPSGEKLADIRIVPNPFNIKARQLQFGESDPDRIMFYNIPPVCTIRIYTERGDLIKTIQHTDGSGDEAWNSVTSSRQIVVSGVYIAHFEVTQDHSDPFSGELLYKKGDAAIRKFIVIR